MFLFETNVNVYIFFLSLHLHVLFSRHFYFNYFYFPSIQYYWPYITPINSPFSPRGNHLPYSNSPHSLNITHPHLDLAVTAAPHPPPEFTRICEFTYSFHFIRSEWKLPLRGRITCQHCQQPKLLNFLYSSNCIFCD